MQSSSARDIATHVGISAPRKRCTALTYTNGNMQFGAQLKPFSGRQLSVLLVTTRAGSHRFKPLNHRLPLKNADNKDKEVGVAVAQEISMDAAVATVLSELIGNFTLRKKDQKTALKASLSEKKIFSPYSQLALERALLNTAAQCSGGETHTV